MRGGMLSFFFRKDFNDMNPHFTKSDLTLWITSLTLILTSFLLFDRGSYLTLVASLIGVTSLIFCAKGHPVGQVLMILFSILYGIISYSFAYYGEMITYLGMTAPMAVVALVSWLTHPYQGNRAQVSVGKLTGWDYLFVTLLTAAVTVVFYFILDHFHTANLIPSTVSVATSFAAAYLTFRRSPYFALAYATNDVVLIVLWILAALADPAYVSVAVCFAVFLFNDVYGFVSWRRMGKAQVAGSKA